MQSVLAMQVRTENVENGGDRAICAMLHLTPLCIET